MGGRKLSYSEAEAREAIAASKSFAEALRRLGMCHTGGASGVLKKWTVRWGIPTDHFDQYASTRARRGQGRKQLSEILVRDSTHNRGHLKQRLFDEGVKARRCEHCGQGEIWNGRRMALILDHVNGVRDDNRLENLRVLCANCAATLDTHCGRKLRLELRKCLSCDEPFQPRYGSHRYCSTWCGQRHDRSYAKGPNPDRRKVERPPYETLIAEVKQMGYCTTGRKYGVSDNAIRKWIRQYEEDGPDAYEGRAA